MLLGGSWGPPILKQRSCSTHPCGFILHLPLLMSPHWTKSAAVAYVPDNPTMPQINKIPYSLGDWTLTFLECNIIHGVEVQKECGVSTLEL
ncbi:hypothetical protein AAC387_Pa09g1329 [Persea americana]